MNPQSVLFGILPAASRNLSSLREALQESNMAEEAISIVGDNIPKFQALVIASALELYAKTGLQAGRAYTPTKMLAMASKLTGKTFKRGEYLPAASAIRELLK